MPRLVNVLSGDGMRSALLTRKIASRECLALLLGAQLLMTHMQAWSLFGPEKQ